jgi:hypothetical protein
VAAPDLTDPARQAAESAFGQFASLSPEPAPAAEVLASLLAMDQQSPDGQRWSATLRLRGNRNLDTSYPVLPPTVVGGQPPRVSVRSVPSMPAFTLDLRRSPNAALYVGVLRYTDDRGRQGVVRVAGTWSVRTASYWGTWLGGSGRGAVLVRLRQK